VGVALVAHVEHNAVIRRVKDVVQPGDELDREEDEPCSSVRVLGESGARRRAAQLLAEAQECLVAFDAAADPLRDLARYAVGRDR
jgi:hypothetical protein